MAKSNDKTRWDVYTWVGSGDIKIRESNVSLKHAKKVKEEWCAKSPKHEAFIASHGDKKLLKGLLKSSKPKAKPEAKPKAKPEAKSKAKKETKPSAKSKKKK